MCSGHACRVLWVHVLNMCCDLLDVKMWCEFFYFAARCTRNAVRGKGLKMPSICPWGFIWANHNSILTSDVDVHLALAVTWHIWLGVGPQFAQHYDIVYALVGLWLCGLLSQSSVVLTHWFYLYLNKYNNDLRQQAARPTTDGKKQHTIAPPVLRFVRRARGPSRNSFIHLNLCFSSWRGLVAGVVFPNEQCSTREC